ncbi:unnamed protein product [Symbiodinium sp. CCMP2592]|nr:unnamed protein product [Symbiodinium sp. CCMP2592]CAE7573386.1 unnamed protein product [Symbiodinium sp. CCMP2592]
MHLFELPFLCLGDWQEEISDPPYAQLLASDCVHCLDDCSSTALPCIGPGNRRRIDFGLGSGHIYASGITHSEGVGDHTAVCYHIAGFDLLAGLRLPRRRPSSCTMRRRDQAAAIVSDLVTAQAEQEKTQRLAEWRSRMRADVSRQSSWIKRRAEIELERTAAAASSR